MVYGPTPRQVPSSHELACSKATRSRKKIPVYLVPLPNRTSGSPIPGGALSDFRASLATRVGERFGSQRSNVSISVHEYARGRGLRVDQSEFARVSTVRKEAFAPA